MLAKYVEDDYIDEYDEENPLTLVSYRCSATVARDRLDLMGVTYDVAVAGFERGLEAAIKHYEEFSERGPDFALFANKRLQVLRALTVDDWLHALGHILREHLNEEMIEGLQATDPYASTLKYTLESHSGFYGFPGGDYRHFLRLIVEEADPQEILTYDLSDLVAGGYLGETDDPLAEAEHLIYSDFLFSRRVIVLTEGDTDRRILERSLKLFYPHLLDYFHFFDFVENRVEGGAGQLANLVRAFAAADIRHRTIALFDNDTAAKAAVSSLDLRALPNNIVVRHYPTIAIAQNYPTLGPSGKTTMDVNGLAGSIELYLGKDVLQNPNGELSPVQWTGYESKVGAYQGQLADKGNIIERFEQKIAICEKHPEKVNLFDWDGIRAILESMRSAFQRADADVILNDMLI